MEKKTFKELGIVKVRKVIQINGSFYICLPKAFIKHHNIKAGDKMMIGVGENLKVSPVV